MSAGLLVLGGGAAGLAAARAAAARGARPLLVTEGPPGGDCTFTGCVPSKTLIEAAEQGLGFADAAARMRAAVAGIAATEDADTLAAEGITVLRGRAAFRSRNRIEVDGRLLDSRRGPVVVATGSRPAIPDVEGLDRVDHLTNETVFDLREPPASLAVLGGGFVGCELAQAFARFGCAVTLVESAPRLLPGADPEVSHVIAERLAAEGVAVRAGARAREVRAEGGTCLLDLGGGEPVEAERLLVATGRVPATSGLGLAAAGVDTDQRGAVRVGARLATSAAGIFAAGDVTGGPAFTHAAYAMGRIAAGNALSRGWGERFDDGALPRVAFTRPEVAQVGLTEAEAARADPAAQVAYLPLTEVDRAIVADDTAGFVTIVAGRRPLLGGLGGGRILGATVVGERAGEIIHEFALAMHTRMFTGRLAQTTHAYPAHAMAVQQAAAQFFGPYGGRRARPARAE